MEKIKGVIFDLDGTVADTLPLCIAAFRAAIEPLAGKTVTDEEIIATFGPSEEGTIKAMVPTEKYEQGVKDYLSHYERLHDICPEPFEGVKTLLEQLKEAGVRLAMVTGKGHKSAMMTLEKYGLAELFEQLEAGWIHGPSKPKGINNVLASWKGLSKDDVIYVGDAPSDVTACREVGIKIVGAAWASTAEPEVLASMQPEQLFTEWEEFKSWLLAQIK